MNLSTLIKRNGFSFLFLLSLSCFYIYIFIFNKNVSLTQQLILESSLINEEINLLNNEITQLNHEMEFYKRFRKFAFEKYAREELNMGKKGEILFLCN